ncbi:MAG: GTP-binding protein [Proteobacteria bacterium]|nr:GTP-binding protein [Pseudomonadota bacterium]
MSIKVAVVGAQGIGKTELLQKITDENHQILNSAPTIGARHFQKKIKHEGDDTFHQYDFSDTSGDERFAAIISNYYRNAAIILLCFDLTDEKSIDKLKSQLDEIKRHVSTACQYILVGTKADETKKRAVTQSQIDDFRAQNISEYYPFAAYPYEETTAKKYPEALIKTISRIGEKLPAPTFRIPSAYTIEPSKSETSKSTNSIDSRLLLDIFIIGGGLIGLGLCIAAIATLITLAPPVVGICLAAAGGFFAVTSTAAYIYKACTEGQEDNESNIVTTP